MGTCTGREGIYLHEGLQRVGGQRSRLRRLCMKTNRRKKCKYLQSNTHNAREFQVVALYQLALLVFEL